jgi:hypothetical protein
MYEFGPILTSKGFSNNVFVISGPESIRNDTSHTQSSTSDFEFLVAILKTKSAILNPHEPEVGCCESIMILYGLINHSGEWRMLLSSNVTLWWFFEELLDWHKRPPFWIQDGGTPYQIYQNNQKIKSVMFEENKNSLKMQLERENN